MKKQGEVTLVAFFEKPITRFRHQEKDQGTQLEKTTFMKETNHTERKEPAGKSGYAKSK